MTMPPLDDHPGEGLAPPVTDDPREGDPAAEGAESAGERLSGLPDAPASQQAEQAVLGAILVDNAAYHRIGDRLSPEYFHVPVHGRIFAAIAKLIDRGALASPVKLAPYFKDDPDLQAVGGAAYLVDLAGAIVSIAHVGEYATAVIESWQRRQLIDIAHTIADSAAQEDIDTGPSQVIERAEQALSALDQAAPAKLRSTAQQIDDTLTLIDMAQRGEGGLNCGLGCIDRRVGIFGFGDVITIAGATGAGKSITGGSIAKGLCLTGKPGAIVDLEMSASQRWMRYLADETGISVERQRRRDALSDADMDHLVEAAATLRQWPLMIWDGAMTMSAVRQRARRYRREGRLDWMMVDYLQLMEPGSVGDLRIDSDVARLGYISRSLKLLAKELDIPVIALAQINRNVDAREDKRPTLGDIRGAGSIEHDSDTILFLFREEYYVTRAEPRTRREKESTEQFEARRADWYSRLEDCTGKIEIICSKARMGREGVEIGHFDGDRSRITDFQPEGSFV